MTYLKTMSEQQRKELGFEILDDKPTTAVCSLYPTLSYRYLCQTCGFWSDEMGNEKQCKQCWLRKKKPKEANQYFKIYIGCCKPGRNTCQTQEKALAWLVSQGMKTSPHHFDGFGEWIDLEIVKDWTPAKRKKFFLTANNFCVSRYGARLIAHPGSKEKSKLPKTADYNADDWR